MNYFFCGIGGSGMLPLALIIKKQGHRVRASDRARDQGRVPEKFAFIEGQGIDMFPQDGMALMQDEILVVSAAVEDSIPDVRAANRLGVPIVTRAQLLAQIMNLARERVTVAGTSGKSTVTGMIGFLLHEMGQNPTVMNGAVFRNYTSQDNPWCCTLTGRDDVFVSEVDESDKSIRLFKPSLAVLTNISLDHASLDELRLLFADYLAKAERAVLNLDDAMVADMATQYAGKAVTFSLQNEAATLCARDIVLHPSGSACVVNGVPLSLSVPGRHNIANALAALGVIVQMGLSLEEACRILGGFMGVRRRLEVVGCAAGVTVMDDFAHNPDKIAASLSALKAFDGRVIVMFQPHGFGPLRLMRKELVESFATHLGTEDVLLMPEPYYAGGTTDRSVSSAHLVADLQGRGIKAAVYPERAACTADILATVRSGDRVIIMGARDDTLSDYARMLVDEMGKQDRATA